MAAPKRPVILRFVFGKGFVKARFESAKSANAVIDNVLIEYTEDQWREVVAEISQRLEGDIRSELLAVARAFREHIIGAGGRFSKPSGRLQTVAKGEGRPQESISDLMPFGWAPRSPRYVARKRAYTGSIKWFDNSNWRKSQYDARYARRVERKGDYPKDAGYLRSAFSPGKWGGDSTWTSVFGPILVRVQRNNKGSGQGATPFSGTVAKGEKRQTQLATVRVSAMNKISPSMLHPSADGNPRLTSLLYGYDRRLGERLGPTRNGIYRPTFEPFLIFFLTRAIPFAIGQRIRKGTSKGSIQIK